MPAYTQRSIAFLTYKGLTCNVRVTYAERMPSVLGARTKFIDFMASNISGRFMIFIKQAFREVDFISMILFLSRTSSWRYKFSPLFIYFQFHRKLIELIKAFLKARVLEYIVLGGGGILRNTTDLPHPYIGILNIVNKRMFYHCTVQTSKCLYVTCMCGRIIINDTSPRSDVI